MIKKCLLELEFYDNTKFKNDIIEGFMKNSNISLTNFSSFFLSYWQNNNFLTWKKF